MLDPKEEQKYKRLRKLGQELHLPIPEHSITLEVFDKDGKLIQKHQQRSHSWTRNAYNHMFSQLAGKDADGVTFEGGVISAKDTGGEIRNENAAFQFEDLGVSVDAPGKGYRGAAASTVAGILVGSGTNPEDFEDYVLQTLIAEGTGANQLNYAQGEAHAISYADTTLKNTLIRYFNNNTVGETSVDVNEVGLVCKTVFGPYTCYYLHSRDKLSSTVTVPSTGQLKVTYTIQLAYPA